MNNQIALVGNPNCGKTTLFNLLTGTYQKVGNWAGVTTEVKQGVYKKDRGVKIFDLPGIYSFDSDGIDGKVAIDFLKNFNGVVINVIDGLNLERNLYLTALLSRLKIKTVIAINFSDELIKNGIFLDEKVLSSTFNVPVIKISALKNLNVDKLMDIAFLSNDYLSVSSFDYAKIKKIADKCVVYKATSAEKFTLKADKFLTGKFTGIPFFALVIFCVYFLSLKLGGLIGQYITSFFSVAQKNSYSFFIGVGVPTWLCDLFCNAVLKGIGVVLSFLPQILILFILLTLLEQSGYMARVSFILDRLFSLFGLGGKSVIPLILSCGCAVTGISATRALEDQSERKIAVFISPFMPCGAKVAVIGWFSKVFFASNPLIATLCYFLSLTVSLFASFVLSCFKRFYGLKKPFIIEIPNLRLPPLKDVFFVLYEKIKDFLVKSGTVIFAVSVFLWILTSFGFSGYVGDSIEKSFLYYLGQVIKYIFYPLGFSNWKASVAVVSGIFAKESVIQTLELIGGNFYDIFASQFSVLSFVAFIILSPPCIATLAVCKRELSSNKEFIIMIIFQFLTAYLVALMINLIGIILLNGLLLSVIIGIIISLGIIFAFKSYKKPCKRCGRCKMKTQYDYMRESEKKEEDAFYPEEWIQDKKTSDREKYFEFYDDIKTSIKEDW